MQYPNGEPSYSVGKMDICDKNIIHYCSTNFGSSGSTILDYYNCRVIGVHIGSYKIGEKNIGVLINYPIEEFYNKYKNEKITKDENLKDVSIKMNQKKIKSAKMKDEKGKNDIKKLMAENKMIQKEIKVTKMKDEKGKSTNFEKSKFRKNKMKCKEIIKTKNKDEKIEHIKNENKKNSLIKQLKIMEIKLWN